MLQSGSVILHHGDVIDVDEEMSPSLENMVVLTWLRLINPALPKLIKQRYGTELWSRTLASIKPEISQALESLLARLRLPTPHMLCALSRGSPIRGLIDADRDLRSQDDNRHHLTPPGVQLPRKRVQFANK